MNLLDLARAALADVSPARAEAAHELPSLAVQPAYDPASERRRARALAMLAEDPQLRLAVIAEAGNPVVVGVAIRGLVYGEIEIPADRYDAAALLALMERHAGETVH